MNLEQMLRQEAERAAPNPLVERTDEIVTRIRRRRRARAAAASVVVGGTLAVLIGVAGQLLPAGISEGERSPAEISPVEPTPSDAVPLSQLPVDSVLGPGRYILPIDGAPSAPLLPVLSVPQGYTHLSSGAVGVSWGPPVDDRWGYVWVWGDVTAVHTHPCDRGGHSVQVGPSVADLANALAAQPLRAGTDPVPVTIGGYDGLYVELSVPDDLDVAACPLGRFHLWPGRWQQDPGQVDMVWIVDVEGERIIFDASHGPAASPEEVAELKDLVTTATFTPADGP